MSSKKLVVAALLSGLITLLTLVLPGCGASTQPIAVGLTPSSTQSIDQAQTVPTITAAVAHDGKNAGVTWSVSGGGTLSAQTTTSATYNAPASVASAFTATVTATSVTDTTKVATLSIKVSPLPLVTTTTLTTTAGTAYNGTLSVSGGTSPYTWSITAGSLPAGLGFNTSTGAITGTPTGTGNGSSVTFKVTDSSAAAKMSASQAITFTVNPPPALTITTASLPAGVMGTAYSQTLQATGGVSPYTWNSAALPQGLILNSSTGVISGTPTGTFTGTTNFGITVTDSETPTNKIASSNLSIAVSAPTLKVTTASLPGGSVGTAYSQTQLQATGGAGTDTWKVTTGALPVGLSLSNAGVITGTPTGPVVGQTSFTVTVTDGETPTPQAVSANLSITVSVTPITITTSGSLPVGVVNSAYAGATLQASGGIPPYTWTVPPGTLPAGLSLSSGGVISGTPTASGPFNFTVTATDSESPTANKAANLSITVNPSLSVATTSLPAGVLGTAYSQTLQGTGGISPYTWNSQPLPQGLSLSSSTGVISGTPSGTFTGTTNFALTLTDSETPPKMVSSNLSIAISAPALNVTTTTLPGGFIGTAYSQTQLQATGGAGAYTWSVPPGTLPAGLSLSSAGVISGTPSGTLVGPVNFTVTVTDSETPTAATKTANLSITISVAPLNVTTTSLPVGVVNSAYPSAGATLQATGGISPYTWSLTGNPAWLSVNPSTGLLSGTPTASGPFNFTVTVTDSETPTAATKAANLSITVNPSLSVATTSLPAGVLGTAYSQTLQGTGGISPYTWNSQPLPQGLSLNSSTGVISGTPTGTFTGTTNFALTLTDSETPPKMVSSNLSIAISAPALSVNTTPAPPIGVINSVYPSTQLQATGGAGTFTWSYTGSLPTGLSLSSGGVISGTPTVTGTFPITVTVQDSESPTPQSANANLSISINATAPLGIVSNQLPLGLVSTAYSATVQATGGVTPYTWSLTGNPAWLSINANTGALSGTPTTAGNFPFTVKVTDNTKPTALTQTANLSITVDAPLTITTTSPLTGGTVGSPYNAAVNASGGQPPYTWQFVSGSLPHPLSFNSNTSNTSTITGVPDTVGTSTFVVSITDSETPPVTVNSPSLSITISAAPPLSITTTSLSGGTVGTPYNATVNATGGVTPYTWSLSGNPAWLSINATTGALSGTPTTAGTTPNFTVTVTDSESPTAATANASLSIAVAQACTGTNNALLSGHYAFLLNGWKGATDATSALGSFVADGAGNLSSGLLDVAEQSKGTKSGTFTGTYCVGSNNLTTINVTPAPPFNNGATFEAALDASDGNGHIISYDNTSSSIVSGLLRKQTTSAFSTSALNGNYAFGMVGADQSANRFAVAGYFNLNGSGSMSGSYDYDDGGSGTGSGPGTGTVTATDFSVASNGRGTVSTTSTQSNMNMIVYVVSSSELLMMAADTATPPMIEAGQVLKQSGSFTNASLNGKSVIELEMLDIGNTPATPDAQVGLLTTNGAGAFSVSLDDNDGGQVDGGTGSPMTLSGNYSVTPATGRVTLSNVVGGGGGNNHNPVFYLIGPNQAFAVGTDNGVDFGMFVPQTGSNFNNASLSGTFLGGSQQPVSYNGSAEVDNVHLDGAGNFTVTSDNNSSGGTSTNTNSGTYAVASSGRVVLSQGGTQVVLLYIINSSQAAVLPTQDSSPKVIDFHK